MLELDTMATLLDKQRGFCKSLGPILEERTPPSALTTFSGV